MTDTHTNPARLDRLLRESEVLRILPIGRASWWSGVKTGRYPQPVRLGPRTTCWRESEIIRLVENGTGG
jgi:predicted DNA-binding transcriptional regulator AlpA